MPPTPVTSINIFCKLSFDNRLHAVGVGPCQANNFPRNRDRDRNLNFD